MQLVPAANASDKNSELSYDSVAALLALLVYKSVDNLFEMWPSSNVQHLMV